MSHSINETRLTTVASVPKGRGYTTLSLLHMSPSMNCLISHGEDFLADMFGLNKSLETVVNGAQSPSCPTIHPDFNIQKHCLSCVYPPASLLPWQQLWAQLFLLLWELGSFINFYSPCLYFWGSLFSSFDPFQRVKLRNSNKKHRKRKAELVD